MPSRREAIQLTPGEIREYLDEQRRIILVTNGPNGMPHPVPMNYGVDDEGRVVMTCFRKGQKVANIKRDPRATLLVESGEEYSELKSVLLYTDVEILDGAENVAKALSIVGGSSGMGSNFTSDMSEQVRASLTKRVILRFTPFRTVSWDHSKLGDRY